MQTEDDFLDDVERQLRDELARVRRNNEIEALRLEVERERAKYSGDAAVRLEKEIRRIQFGSFLDSLLPIGFSLLCLLGSLLLLGDVVFS